MGRTVIAAAGAEPGQAVSIPNLPLSPAMPFVRIRRTAAGEAPGSYRIVVRVLPLDAGAEIEPDDATAQANELPLPGEAIGYLGWRRDPGLLPAVDRRAGGGQRAGRRPRSDPRASARGSRSPMPRATSCPRRAAGVASASRCGTSWCRQGPPSSS